MTIRKLTKAIKAPPEKHRRVVLLVSLLILLLTGALATSCGTSSSSSQDQSAAGRSTDEQTTSSAPSENATQNPVPQIPLPLVPRTRRGLEAASSTARTAISSRIATWSKTQNKST